MTWRLEQGWRSWRWRIRWYNWRGINRRRKAGAREGISYNILQAWQMHNGTRELRNISQVPLLTSRPGRRTPEQS